MYNPFLAVFCNHCEAEFSVGLCTSSRAWRTWAKSGLWQERLIEPKWEETTTGITGLWQPSVHSDVAFWSFDVGSSYHCEAEFTKRWIVHPL